MEQKWAYDILTAKRRDSQQSLLSMARSRAIAKSTIYERARSCKKYITKQTILLDFRRLGLVQYFFIVRPFQHMRKRVYEYLSRHKDVNSLFIVSGADALGEAIFADCITAENFFENLESVKMVGSVERYIVQQEISREGFLPATIEVVKNEHSDISRRIRGFRKGAGKGIPPRRIQRRCAI